MTETTLMDFSKEGIKRWVDVLRSGTFKQGRYFLKNPDDEYCCLGVKATIDDIDIYMATVASNNANIYKCFRKELGDLIIDKLIKMNDSKKSFNEIADVIEKELL